MFNYGIFLYFLFEILLTHFRVPILHIKAFTHRSQHINHDNTPWWVCPSNSWSEAKPNNPCRGNHLNNDQPNQDSFFRDRSINQSINQPINICSIHNLFLIMYWDILCVSKFIACVKSIAMSHHVRLGSFFPFLFYHA